MTCPILKRPADCTRPGPSRLSFTPKPRPKQCVGELEIPGLPSTVRTLFSVLRVSTHGKQAGPLVGFYHSAGRQPANFSPPSGWGGGGAKTREITEGLKPIKKGIDNLLQAITFPAFPSIQSLEKPSEGQDTQNIGTVAEKYQRNFATKSETDTTYGLYDKNGNFYIGNKPVVIIDNNIKVDDKKYEGAPGLWELIVSKNPDDNIYTYEVYDNYAKLMLKNQQSSS